uniref:Uncharacterized protein n=1 Tax=Plectus sambesii TaxID=2011161 RepID=A0A914W1R2_9BILA
MKADGYRNIVKDALLTGPEENLSLDWIFQQDNDPKQMSRQVQLWLLDNQINALGRSSQSPNLNAIENLKSIKAKAITMVTFQKSYQN